MKRIFSFLALLSIMTVLFACGGGGGGSTPAPTPTPTPGGSGKSVTGAITDPVSGSAIIGATVLAFPQLGIIVAKTVAATPAGTALTNTDGSYTISGLNAGTTYYFEIAASGFATFTYYNIIPDVTNILTLETARVLPSSIASLTATASGKVKNASTNEGLPGMTVKIRSGVNNQTGTVVNTATTDTTGAYSFASLAAGTYTAEVTGTIGTTAIITSYFTLVSIPTMTTLNTNQDFPVTTPLSGTGTGQYRIVLDWGNDPSDLDSHLTGPASSTDGTRFHTAYYSVDYPSGSATFNTSAPFNLIAGPTTEAFLDVDNTSHGFDNGPETTTIVVPRSGTYRFYVHHFSGSSTISASGAQVKVYRGSALLATFNPPVSTLGDNAVWSVFTMDITSGGQTINPVNTISAIFTDSLPKAANAGFDDFLLFSNMPRK